MTAAAAAFVAHHRPSGVLTRDDFRHDSVLHCDVVVVGSGAGGAVAAAELAECGVDVVVLEEGRYYSTRDFTANASAMVRQLYRGGGATAALGSPPILYQEGRTVGGSTVINGGMSWRTPEPILSRWEKEHGLTGIADDLGYYFDRVEKRISVAEQDPESIGRDNHLLREGADKMGWKWVANRRNQVHCPGSNNCAFGCPTGAKQSALVTYIPRALHFGARVVSDVRADKILFDGKRAIGVEGRVVLPGQRRGVKITVRAKLVISACGAIHTPAFLWRSGVRSPSHNIGANLSLHPNVKVVALFDDKVRGWEGVHQAYQVREFQDDGLVFAAVNVPPSIVAMTTPIYGDDIAKLMADYDSMMVAGMLCEDTSVGRVRFGPGGRPIATYQLNDYDANNLIRGASLLSEMLLAVGAREIYLPFGDHTPITTVDEARALPDQNIAKERAEVVTVHMMGTAQLGADPTRAVTNSHGQVFDADRLFVCDASLFPTPIGVNPMETIQALSTRNVHHILNNRQRYLS